MFMMLGNYWSSTIPLIKYSIDSFWPSLVVATIAGEDRVVLFVDFDLTKS